MSSGDHRHRVRQELEGNVATTSAYAHFLLGLTQEYMRLLRTVRSDSPKECCIMKIEPLKMKEKHDA
ncbi:hypothetical protein BST61_g11442 [Cercospora zeina]